MYSFWYGHSALVFGRFLRTGSDQKPIKTTKIENHLAPAAQTTTSAARRSFDINAEQRRQNRAQIESTISARAGHSQVREIQTIEKPSSPATYNDTVNSQAVEQPTSDGLPRPFTPPYLGPPNEPQEEETDAKAANTARETSTRVRGKTSVRIPIHFKFASPQNTVPRKFIFLDKLGPLPDHQAACRLQIHQWI